MRTRGGASIGAKPKAAPPRNAPFPFGGKSLASAAVALANSRSRTESRGELEPRRIGLCLPPPALWTWSLNGGGELFNIVPGQVFDCHPGGVR